MRSVTPIPETTFQFPCYRTLNRSMGKVDAIIQSNEIAIQHFLAEAEKQTDRDAYLRSMNKRYGTNLLGYVDPATLGLRIRHLYLVSTYQQAEDFLRRFKEEHPRSREWAPRCELPLLEHVLRNIGPNYDASAKVVGRLEIKIFNYYRRVRNRFVHVEAAEEKRPDKGLETTARELRLAVDDHADLSTITAPNAYHAISFYDFVLFTATFKRIARGLCRAGRPEDEDIVRMVQRLDAHPRSTVNLKGLRKWKSRPERLKSALTTLLQVEFNLSEEESKPVVDLLIATPPLV